MLNSGRKTVSVESKGLYFQFVLASLFMFILPLLLSIYLITYILFAKDPASAAEYARLIIFWMVASGILGFIIIKRPMVAILSMIAKAKSISSGKISEKIEVVRSDELQDLALSFNRITADLERKIVELEYSRNLTRELFQKISHAITSSQKIDALLALIAQSVRKVLHGGSSFIALQDTASGKLYLKAYSGIQKNISENMDLPSNSGAIGFVVKNAKSIIVRKDGAEAFPGISAEEKVFAYSTMICVPILDNSGVRGIIGVTDSADTEKLDNEDLSLMENIAGQIATSIENMTLNKNIEETYYQTLLTLARVVEAKDRYSAGHVDRVSKYVTKMAEEMGLDHETSRILIGGAFLHDLGKVGIEDSVLKKDGFYTDEEYGMMKEHAIIGENILKPLRSMSKLSELVRHHHEFYDGSGYPDKLSGENIPICARMLTIADIYDAITTDRPYRKAMTKESAIETLRSYAGNKLDPGLTEIFIKTLSDGTTSRKKA